ncbi:MFS family permease [Nocardioides aromaticivorans]|uniref:MFS family permease n=1 Tax=Nocardioides aromaticivorans TaxID=200618 RepID=A0A7Y9ZGE4_9ACTN|nr:MFS transporter [Nocardioides aromaticivorans]NYI44043.1 MFS family permease [Nocardioides aromaticivorans]
MRPETEDRWLFATLAAISVVTAVVSSLGAPLVPSIATRYDVPLATAQWVLTSTLIAAAAATPAIGRWGSGRLRRPVVLGALGVVLAGAVLAALPLGMGALIAGRAGQGMGLAVAPLTLAVARDVWTGDRLVSRLSLLSIATVAGAGLGYPFTGLVAEHAGIAGAYGMGAALVAVTLGLAIRFLPRQADGEPQQVDLASVVLVAVGMVAVLLAVSQGEAWGWLSAPVVLLAAGGVVLLAGWVLRTRHLATHGGQPLVDLRLAGRPGVLGPNAVAFALAVGMYGLLTVVVLLVRADGSAGWGLDRGAAAAGLVLVPYAVLSVTGSRIALRVARRFGAHLLLPIGATVFASSMVLVALRHDTLPQALVAMAVGGLGSGFTFSSLPMLIVPHVPREETGSAMAFNQLLRYLGFSVGSAVTVALLEVYGGHEAAFRATVLTMAGICFLAGAGVALGGRRTPARA